MALAFTSGCNRHPERRDCVDEAGRITNDQNCQMVEQRRQSGYTGSLPYYHYLYGGSSGGRFGDTVFNGNPVPGMSSGSGGGILWRNLARGIWQHGEFRSWRIGRRVMKRHTITPRSDWAAKVEKVGLVFHTLDDSSGSYWDESAYYEFSAAEVDRLEAATEKLQEMCLAAGQFIIDHNRWSDLKIPPEAIAQIKKTWNDEPPALYGRFDLAYEAAGVQRGHSDGVAGSRSGAMVLVAGFVSKG
jgi:hypothetical protein